jgi:hypothetical protein
MAAGAPVAVVAATSAGSVFLLAGAAKLRDARGLEGFVASLGMGPRAARVARRVVPALELLVGGWLLVGVAPLGAALAGCVLAAGFVAALMLAVVRGVAEPCRCFGALDRVRSHRVSLARALLVLAGTSIALAGAAESTSGDVTWPARATGLALAVCAVAAFALVGEVAAFRAGVQQELSRGQVR